jgi:hypothetical protein
MYATELFSSWDLYRTNLELLHFWFPFTSSHAQLFHSTPELTMRLRLSQECPLIAS